jgi:hypothetical protein
MMIKSGQAVIRRAFLCPALFLLALLTLVTPESSLADEAGAQLPHLRIVYGEAQTMPDGTVFLPLEIHLDDAHGVNRMESLSRVTAGVASLPARASTVTLTKPLVYRSIPVTKTGEQWTILLSADSPRSFAVRVQARTATNGMTTYLAAETNCFVFGRKLEVKAESKAEALPPAWFSGLGLSIDPPFYYWPQTGDPLQVTLYLGNRTLPKTTLTVFDGSSPVTRLLTDHAGRVVYVPPDDQVLNRQGEKATKQILLVTAYDEGNDHFVATRTLRLHRNRFTHRQSDAGLALFGATALLTCGAVAWVRRRRRQV